ncbi:HpcH/HpaI aldolase/citrate lyase family protein [Skermanella stibiiresistens]|uniref:HpcH/HpaI aldolase/citrate lyase family protein n=1 Tax=Skermanella stibiiresistens TaxID=913326 RepID=UPI0004AC66A6|nr:CoA ester lyase [Skermanella stibiiresistens]
MLTEADHTKAGWRSLLFVPATRPDRFAKAAASGADAVCVDLEDAVPPDAKDGAREEAVRFLTAPAAAGCQSVVRINSVRTESGLRDVLAILEVRPGGGFIAVPKIDSAEEVQWIDQLLTSAGVGLGIVAQIETLRGIENATAIAAASPRIAAIMFGGLDLAAELGSSVTWDALFRSRARVVHASALAGVPAIDMPFVDVGDPDGCAGEARRVQGLGFSAKMAIHPTQVPVINAAFSPTDEEVSQARRVIAALDEANAASAGVALLDGRMIERPVALAMRRVLARAR